ncbi:YacL family protein [Shewanella cyperi]|uniref:YacL family protein n=1 Tax=Shewanella cyperi TaxID=2814292 RepID=A0A974XLW5_9GAMM|nr:YacL family protein [Shewanella cyperi]QSX29441.1 YacL family protein [Shewanella cyperi]
MEFEFRRNSLDGSLFANFSMEHEVMGRWFCEELGEDRDGCTRLLAKVAQLQAAGHGEWRQIGRDFTLELDAEQARIFANVLGYDSLDELDEGMSMYDSESEASCGLEDFQHALESWQLFVNDSR